MKLIEITLKLLYKKYKIIKGRSIMCSESFLTTGQVAKQLGVSITTVKSYEKKNHLKPDRVLPSGRRLYSVSTVENFCKSLTKGGSN